MSSTRSESAAMPSAYLVDSNVLVYAVDRRSPTKQAAAVDLLSALMSHGTAALSTQVLAEFLTTVTGKIPEPLSPGEAWDRLTELAGSFPVHEVSLPIVLEAARAVRDHGMSYWDAQVWATAKLNQIPYVLSEDLQGWATLEAVRFLNPIAKGFDLTRFTRGG